MRHYSSELSAVLQATPEKVFQALTDWSLRSQWRPGIAIQWDGEPKAHVGQRVTFRVQGGLFPYSFSFRVTGVEAPRLLYFEYEDGPLKGRAALEVAPQEGGTKAIFHWMKVEPVGFLSRVLYVVGWGMKTHQAQVGRTFEMLKEYLGEN